ncbi:MAG: phosphatase PAP2 family protein [Oscillospiraceae bacterium]|nr:phosphatase PAP2 family protein [Oscillospiraceae bacterium]
MLDILNSLAVSFDLPILDWIQANMTSSFMDAFMPVVTLLGDAGIFWIAWAILLLFFPKTRKIGLGMGFALILGLLVCNVTLKPLVGRPRPYDFQEAEFGVIINLLIERQHDFSFPSGHTIASFEAATVLLKNSKKMGIPAMILAVIIAFSRLYLYVHYPTDVIFSVFAGILFAFIGDALAAKVAPKLAPRKRGRYEA